jgi:peptidoglycan hydrolase-like amidase
MPETLLPVIPESITVHLGAPDSNAENITVPFVDYVKNVASSEIYPTWPEEALRANIYAIITYALNRIYTEWYPSRGYNFDITNTTSLDQAYVKDREIYENIGYIVDDIFNDYVVRQGSV